MEQIMTEPHVEDQARTTEKSWVRLSLGLIALALATFATVMALVILIPDENDYAEVSVLKHERLASIQDRKIVLIGGSNLAYGIESDIIEQETGCSTVNMGMNGYFGARFILNEVKPQLRAGDIVVIALEWDNFGKTIEGSGKDLLAVTKANPGVWPHLTLEQKVMVLRDLPFVAQAKVIRIAETNMIELGLINHVHDATVFDMNQVENLAAFDHQGDLYGHDGVEFTEPLLEHGDDITAQGLELELIDLIKTFGRDMAARDVTVVMSYTPTAGAYFAAQSETIERAHALLTSGQDAMNAPRPPSGFIFENEYFFDNLYHLRTSTRGIRTHMLAEDIQSAIGSQNICNTITQ